MTRRRWRPTVEEPRDGDLPSHNSFTWSLVPHPSPRSIYSIRSLERHIKVKRITRQPNKQDGENQETVIADVRF